MSQNRFAVVFITTKGISDSRATIEVLRQAYGPATFKPNQFMENYIWDGKQVRLSYDENAISRDAKIWFFSLPLLDEEETAKKNKAKKGVSGL